MDHNPPFEIPLCLRSSPNSPFYTGVELITLIITIKLRITYNLRPWEGRPSSYAGALFTVSLSTKRAGGRVCPRLGWRFSAGCRSLHVETFATPQAGVRVLRRCNTYDVVRVPLKCLDVERLPRKRRPGGITSCREVIALRSPAFGKSISASISPAFLSANSCTSMASFCACRPNLAAVA